MFIYVNVKHQLINAHPYLSRHSINIDNWILINTNTPKFTVITDMWQSMSVQSEQTQTFLNHVNSNASWLENYNCMSLMCYPRKERPHTLIRAIVWKKDTSKWAMTWEKSSFSWIHIILYFTILLLRTRDALVITHIICSQKRYLPRARTPT